MPLTVSPVTEQDLPIIVAIDHAAMSGGPLPLVRQTLCGFPSHASYISDILATLRTNFVKRTEQDMHYYKVTDADIPPTDPYNGIICFCVWKIHDTTRSPAPDGPSRAQPLRPSNFPATSLSAYVAKLADDLRAEFFSKRELLVLRDVDDGACAPAARRRQVADQACPRDG